MPRDYKCMYMTHVCYCCCLPLTLASEGVRSFRSRSTNQILRQFGQQFRHSSVVYPQVKGRQRGAYVGAVEDKVCRVWVGVIEGA